MNILPKKLHNDVTGWRKVLEAALTNPVEKWIPGSAVGEARFYVAALFGRLNHLGASREAVGEGDLREAVNSLTRVNALAMDQEHETLTHSRASLSVSALAAAVLLCEGEDAGLEVTSNGARVRRGLRCRRLRSHIYRMAQRR